MAEVEANGNGVSVPNFGEVADFEDDALPEPIDESAAPGSPPPEEEPEELQRNLYFVRIPKPVVDDSAVKKLQEKFQNDIAQVKEMNAKLQAKRGELNELRNKLREARSLKDGVSPEYGEKATMLQELRQKRDGYLGSIKEIRILSKGLDCRSEDELDTKINELEALIRGGEIKIREERDTVRQIAKLNAQREKVREFESQKDLLTQYEEELNFIKRCIEELESEFSVLRGEREATDGLIKEWRSKLDSKQAEMKELEELQQVVVDAKNRTLEELSAAREKVDSVMQEYRDNRKLSAVVRDLVESGQVDQAREAVQEQVEQMMSKLNTDAKYRAAYFKLWEGQRRFPVSELLPNSSSTKAAPAQLKGGKPAPKALEPQGKKKAEAIIAGLMESTRQELSGRGKMLESDIPEPVPEVVLPRAIAKPEPKPIAPKPADNLFKHKVDMPSMENAYDADFVPPVIKSEAPQLSDVELKAKVRAEQKAKAAEAEERKKRLEKKKSEAQEKKKHKAATKKQEAPATSASANSAATRVEDVQPATDDSAVELSGGEEELTALIEDKPAKPAPVRRNRGFEKVVKEVHQPTIAKRPKKEKNKVKQWWQQNQPLLILGIVVFVCLLLAILFVFSR